MKSDEEESTLYVSFLEDIAKILITGTMGIWLAIPLVMIYPDQGFPYKYMDSLI